jgi:hypothetical protein
VIWHYRSKHGDYPTDVAALTETKEALAQRGVDRINDAVLQ